MAALHARCFTYPPPWGADEFRSITDSPGMFLLARPHGLLVGRTAADEAEILTLAVDPAVRRQGVGRVLVEAFVQEAASRGAERAYLEVAAGNIPARRLYHATGWTRIGVRRGYYDGADGIVMFHPLG